MDFDDRARLDTSRTSRRGGGRGGFGGRGGLGGGLGGGYGRRGGRRGGLAVGGGGAGLLLALVVLLLGGIGGGGSSTGDFGGGQPAGQGVVDLSARCQTGADADRDPDCRVVALENSMTEHWSSAISGYRAPTSTLFTGAVDTACGRATSAVGPFYCPADEGVYVDLAFFDDLRTRFGAQGGDFAVAYVLAHEHGHHVQGLLGQRERADRLPQEGPQSGPVRLELQADCLAGVWAANAQRDGFVTFDETDVSEGLSAAAAVGDDRIQEAATGRVDPEGWTHGSAEQRQRWFTTGLRSGQASACDTFRGSV